MSDETESQERFGPNAWLVDEMYEQYREDPSSVSASWQEFFADYRRPGEASAGRDANGDGRGATITPAPETAPAPPQQPPGPAAEQPPGRPAGPATAVPTTTATDQPAPLRGAAARIVANMEASLQVPTATSVRVVPARLLEVNRKVLNNYLARTRGGKVSFTHLIGYAVVQALHEQPAMNSSFHPGAQGEPDGVIRHNHVGLGLAVDQQKSDGSRTLLVPVIRDADTLGFRGFWVAYEDLIRKVRTNKITADDFAGATASLTNPGTIGTVQSVPRLMPGQGVIVGVGSLDYPAEWQAADPHVLAEMGVSKVITITSTYDHRVIQGAESGLFLQRVHRLLLGEEGFYDAVFRSMSVPYEPVRWRRDVNPIDREHVQLAKQVHVQSLINMYRVRGHLIADLDPLAAKEPHMYSELDPATYGLTIWDLDREFYTDGLAGRDVLPLGDILGLLRDAYCRTIGVEYMFIQEPDQKRWIQEHVEGVPTEISQQEQRHVLDRLNAAEAFERFLHTKYVGQKRFGLEGAESAIPIIDTVLDEAARAGLPEAVLGTAHRGRLNVLINIVGKSYGELFREFEGDIDPLTIQGSGDVKYHKGASGKYVGASGIAIAVSLASNPSHLEAVDPVVEGMARAKQDLLAGAGLAGAASHRGEVLPLLVHGDAAFAGQGVVAETMNLSALSGYSTGGTVHLVIDNQLGFTTSPESARSSVYATDISKMVQAPVFHVNGDDPEACVRVARLAFAFRQAFHKDVVIHLVCYRRYGHNEGDDPSYTQPLMYERIEHHRSVRKLYTEALVNRGDISLDEAEKALDDFSARLQAALDQTRSSAPPKPTALPPAVPPAPLPAAVTAVRPDVLDRIATALHRVPDGFTLHPKLARQFEQRAQLWASGQVDWSLAEALAFGSLLLEGTDVRLAGQDSRRGTFSQRHAVLVDHEDEHEYFPLAALAGPGEQGRFMIYDSLLSEYAALGFEYGYSVAHKDALVAWEAQFGDFINGGQIIIDQFLVAAEEKWGQSSGLVLLLPHGYEGQGPEHSSGRIERFLELGANDNIAVVVPTTAAQYFHVLRRQLHRPFRKPLIVFTPKWLLRRPESRSPIAELSDGAFREVLDDATVTERATVRRVVLASGKVAVEAQEARPPGPEATGPGEAAVVRVEQLYPWPATELTAVLASYPNADELVWLQEEPVNMGAAAFVAPRLAELAAASGSARVRIVARAASGAPAGGIAALHQLEQQDLMTRAFS